MAWSLTPYETFFIRLHELDMDNRFEVQKLAINFRKWAKWNKGKVIIDIYESFELNTIVVIHNLFDEVKICDSWTFLADVEEVLEQYADTDESFDYMTYFWYEIAKI